MKRGRIGATSGGTADVFSSALAGAAATGSSGFDATAGSPMVSVFAGEIDGDSTDGNSILGCGCSSALSGFAAVPLLAASIALRLDMDLRPRLVVHQSVATFGYQLVTNRAAARALDRY